MIHRKGFTLLELVLALAVLAILSAIVLPPFVFLLSDRRLNRSADQLRVEIAKTRLDAMRGGRVLVLSGTIGSTTLDVVPFFTASDATESSETNGPSALLNGAEQAIITPTAPSDPSAYTRTITLPETITVAGLEAVASTRTMVLANESSGMNTGNEGISTSQSIFFYPDGSMSDGLIRLAAPDGEQVAIAIRGVTGATTIIDGLMSEGVES